MQWQFSYKMDVKGERSTMGIVKSYGDYLYMKLILDVVLYFLGGGTVLLALGIYIKCTMAIPVYLVGKFINIIKVFLLPKFIALVSFQEWVSSCLGLHWRPYPSSSFPLAATRSS